MKQALTHKYMMIPHIKYPLAESGYFIISLSNGYNFPLCNLSFSRAVTLVTNSCKQV